MSSRTSLLALFIAFLFISQATAQSESEDYQRRLSKFGRSGRGGAKFIRFGRSGANTWDEDIADLNDELLSEVKRAGAKFIRFG